MEEIIVRALKTSDIFAFSRCLKTIGIKDEIKKIAENKEKYKNQTDAGIDIIYKIFDMATEKNGEKEIYKFLAGPFEMKPDEVENLAIDELIKNIKQLGNPDVLKTFFKQAVR
jgi:hypothetical protein